MGFVHTHKLDGSQCLRPLIQFFDSNGSSKGPGPRPILPSLHAAHEIYSREQGINPNLGCPGLCEIFSCKLQ